MSLSVVRERTVCLRRDAVTCPRRRMCPLIWTRRCKGRVLPSRPSSHAMRREELTADEPMTQR